MRKLQFSLVALLGLVSFVAVAAAALARPNPWWASGLVTAAAATVVVALLAAIFRSGRPRAFAGGFALVGGAYLLLVFGPGLGERIGQGLLTTRALVYAESKWHPDVNAGPSTTMSAATHLSLAAIGNGKFVDLSAPGGLSWFQNGYYVTPIGSGSAFQQIGQALWTITLALAGGLVARCWQTGPTRHNHRDDGDATGGRTRRSEH